MKTIRLERQKGSDPHYQLGSISVLCQKGMRERFGITAQTICVKVSHRRFKGSMPIEFRTSNPLSSSKFCWGWRMPLDIQPRGRWKILDGGATAWLQRNYIWTRYKTKTLYVSFEEKP